MSKRISIIIPVYNEADNLQHLYEEIRKATSDLRKKYRFEMIFVNDGSTDNTAKILSAWAAKNKKVKYLEFSRNFGKEMATTAGIHHSRGDAAIMMDADMQHPPNLIGTLIKKWEKGDEMVIGVRKTGNHETITRKFFSFVFYRILKKIGDTEIIASSTDYRLIDKKVIREFIKFTERNRMTRGLLDWMGFKRGIVYFKAGVRRNGNGRYSYIKLLQLAVSGFTSLSYFPLKFAGYLGIIITLVSGTLGLFIFAEKYLLKDPLNYAFSGPAILAVINLFLIGIVLSCLGLITLYIGSIHQEVVNRPMYVVRKKKNF
ncbi:glycosyltransferase [Candidatus Gottesmanbacteria bacterium CG11_big_fil_rev_8_21_14_0_20_37_11]|uniref:Glycosyltransferase n=3 Tax=Candidatus Gottesmaniibacteriota TaxID=1752720 RepID=A0A2M7RPI1_9BACT|nr:MAG: hypothetical protein AUJ73_03020 [Candidatus Gottesmanbacteria bacterium CG1_02_37_22]PIP32782.1 MAG: glycosyltransferase [Candidatus Gottesmanbacteria bacterium CG23_combo_of_CG06-09_8_20_14_all_37_19]PIR08654.1 MAG: glycosyltransferase [Candidatus Gottesmanbacteria bacterium CG11_big_fil_rev_8_21_14_0_20_37_11]PIZ02223.1 MAG: glycosyltransferase [Candidatus Gottesmanbacteria bacterium CG_4_10_14_0_8_um_filter_37_24]